MDTKKKDNEAKRAYIKPKLLTIELALNEVLSVGCKSDSTPGPLGPCEAMGVFFSGS
ncbi:MAG: hypothetical protein IIC78_01420 [Chloroflexi bacterium]|nr:hypothetical protein [Chloroflexota bacterium]